MAGEWFDWEWDESLFVGAAAHYERGRLPYAPGLADAFAAAHADARRHVSCETMGSVILGCLLVLAGGLLGLAPIAAARVVNAVRIWPPPDRLTPGVIRSCRVVGFLAAALGLVLLMPAVA